MNFLKNTLQIFAMANLTSLTNCDEHKQKVDKLKLGDKEQFDKEPIHLIDKVRLSNFAHLKPTSNVKTDRK